MHRAPISRRALTARRAAGAVVACCMLVLCGGAAVAAETVADLVERPGRLPAPDTAAWDYQSKYFLENAYKSMDEGNYANARQLMARVMERHPGDIRSVQIAMYVSYRLEDWPEAERLLSRLVAMRSTDIAALIRRGYVRSRLELFRQSLNDFEAVAARDQLNPLTREYVEKSIAEVRPRWLEAKKRMDGEWNAVQPEMAAMTVEERWDDLEKAAGDFLRRRPECAEARYTLGLAYLGGGKYAEAGDEFAMAAVLAPGPELASAIDRARATVADRLTPDWARGAGAAPRADAPAAAGPSVAPGPVAETLPPGAESEWNRVTSLESELRGARDWSGLEALYGELVGNPDFATYAYTSRAYLYFSLGRYEEAKADFTALLGQNVGREDRALALEMIAAVDAEIARQERDREVAEAWKVVEERERALREAGDWPALEEFYGRLIGEGTFAGHAYQSRAYLRHSQGRLEEAEADFAALQDTDIDERGRQAAQTMMADIAAERRATAGRKELEKRAAELARSEDWAAVERLYDERVAGDARDAHAVAMRGFARLDLGRVEEAEADFAAALALDPAPGTRNRVEDVRKTFRDIRAEGNLVGSPRAEEYLGKIDEFVAGKRFAEAAAYLAKLDKFRLNADQEGRRDFFAGELLWSEERRDEAYHRYRLATTRLPDGYYRSQALWKRAEYHLGKKDREGAVAYIQESVAALPEAEWRLIQAGYAYSGMGMDSEVVASFEKARTMKTLREEEADFYPTLARSYRNLGDQELFHTYMRRQIELDTEKVLRDPREDAVMDLYGLRRDYANMARRVGGHQFMFADRYEHKDYMVQYQNEINLQLRITRDIRAEAYFQTIATLASRFSGSYFDTWSGIDRDYSGQSNLHDGVNVVAGLRVYPLPRLSGLSVAFDQVFRIGRETRNDTRAHIGYYGAIGNDWNPVKCNWTFVSLWADAIWSFRNDDFTLRSEGRLGRSFRADMLGDKVVVTPYLGLVGGYSGKDAPRSERAFLEGGPGIMFRKYFRESRYFAPRSSIDFVVQYRVGFTHNRSNALSIMLFHSF